MLLRHVIRDQQENQQIHRLAVRRFKRDRLRQAHESSQRRFQALDTTVWHGDAMTEAGRAKPFAREQVVGDDGTGNATVVFEN
ncbi:hypothetical protein D3C81_2082330 [compost metagenome]